MRIRWGIMGTGGVANAFADALRDVREAQLVAVGSREQITADRFAEQHQIEGHAWDSYEMLVEDPDVDAVYVASPASHHYRHAMMALKAGKYVLVEKPFTTNADQALRLMTEAHDRNLFLMEAMWCRFIPAYGEIRRLLDEHAIGEARVFEGSFGGRAVVNPRTRPFRIDLAGGALMDAAVYPISLANMVFAIISIEVHAAAMIGSTGVDEQAAVLMRGPGGVLAMAFGGLTTTFDARATIYGTEGMIVLPSLIDPPWIRVDQPDRAPLTIDCPRSRHRLAYQVDEVHACVTAGECESKLMPLYATHEVMRVLDAARAQIGLRFPDDVEAL